MTQIHFHSKKGDKTEHGCPAVKQFGMGVEAKTRQLPLRHQGGLEHGKTIEGTKG